MSESIFGGAIQSLTNWMSDFSLLCSKGEMFGNQEQKEWEWV